MKKIIAIVLAAVLLMCASTVLAEVNWGTKSLNKGEIAGYALSAFLGEPSLINVKQNDSFDEINARYIFIGLESMGCDLGVAIRVSDTQMYFWALDLTPDNIIKAKLALDEEAPICSLIYYEGDVVKDSAIYYKEYSSILTYDKFKSDVERITSSLGSGDMNASSGGADPILSCFPGLSWGMSKDELMNTFGKDMFTDLSSEAGTSVMASPEIFGEKVLVMFIFNDEKVDMFSAMISKENSEKYLDALTQAYGTPHQTTTIGALNGRLMDIKDDPSGDSYAWKTNKSLIILDGSTIQYWSLY